MGAGRAAAARRSRFGSEALGPRGANPSGMQAVPEEVEEGDEGKEEGDEVVELSGAPPGGSETAPVNQV